MFRIASSSSSVPNQLQNQSLFDLNPELKMSGEKFEWKFSKIKVKSRTELNGNRCYFLTEIWLFFSNCTFRQLLFFNF